ncbi:FAD-dependent oxidoreductase [Streptomyces sp. NPDC086023]|uniref:FAD-dependent oxidoreductase n=1 Tax=Streptomyces sp. NPDC086023 TaxID=3365746 RepID=UPI0037D43063
MTDVLVVGAGPTGLTLACDLARRGVDVRVIDGRDAPHGESRGKTLHPRSLEILADLGVDREVLAHGAAHQVFRKYFDGVPVQDTDPFAPGTGPGHRPGARFDGAVFAAQWRIEEVLRRRLERLGTAVEFGARLAGLGQDEDAVRAVLADGRELRAGYAVGCDGGHSTVRRELGVPFEGHSAGAEAMICGDVEAPGLSRDVWHQWFTADGAVLMWPVPGTASFQIQTAPELGPDGKALPPSLAAFQRQFDRHARVPGIRLRRPSWLSSWRVNVRMARRFRVGRVFLAGDAAHVHPIAGGLGMNTGIQDAFNLGWKLALAVEGRGGTELLDSYEQERGPVAAWTLKITDERMEHVTAAVRRPGTGTEAALTGEVPPGYRWSPLAEGTGAGRSVPGDPAPDIPLPGGTWLSEALAGGGFTLLGTGSGTGPGLAAVAAAHGGAVRPLAVGTALGAAAEAAVREAFAVTGDALVLIRPDHHVALVAEGRDPEPVLRWLDAL